MRESKLKKSSGNPAAIRLKPSQLTLFTSQISMLLHSGISLVEGLALLRDDLDGGRFKEVVADLYESVSKRMTLSEAMEKTRAFPPYLVRMANIGEVSGSLEEVMASSARYYEREQELRKRVRSAIEYPVILFVLMSAVVLLLIVQVLPMFDELLSSLGGSVPGVVRALMSFGEFVYSYWYIILFTVIAVAALVFFIGRAENGSRIVSWLKINFPVVRSVYRKISAEKFAAAMAYMLNAGIDVDTSLELSKSILHNPYMESRISRARELVAKGEPIDEALLSAGIFPRLFCRMLGQAFKTGNIDTMMISLSETYTREADAALKRVVSTIEPVFVAVLSVIVGIILISVMLPLTEIMSSI